ncbi:scavenger receptor cysteine-rich type 1 protein M130-like [Sphaeramia orbicularis]|uniref:scavenger receptor cysteine-rich type 1 protein M130-like n=1 Tax=Sphaeramia orbicularis TaxID=375764 RepID=UPI00117E6CBC|nr:scavenger receptor cysteine-rich type 1 protein M130-like [Sphaeramia orbicularis]
MDLRVLVVFTSLWSSGLLVEMKNSSTASYEYRLVGGASRCHGELQMKLQDEDWKSVSWVYWNLWLANRACAELDCGTALSTREREEVSTRDMWEMEMECDKTSLIDCFSSIPCSVALELKCSDSVRLVHGSSLCSGRLQVRSNQSWSSVCEGHFDLQDAQVVCRELGCGAPSVLRGVLYGETEAPLWRTFQCEGNESVLLDCGSSASDTCSSGKAADVSCSDRVGVRLVGGASRCDGSLQIEQHGEWRDMESHSVLWMLKTADVICGHLDCGSALSTVREDRSYRPLWLVSSTCIQNTSAVKDCVSNVKMMLNAAMNLVCADSVRLVHGSSLCSGRLQVRSNQSWSSVCEEDLDLNDTQVVCRELGCGAPSVLRGALYGQGEAPVWTSEFQCEGNESVLLDCGRSASDTCSSGRAVDVSCSDPVGIKLVGGASRCDGSVQIKQHDEWRHVENFFYPLTLKAAAVMCRQLDCGSVVSVGRNNTIHTIIPYHRVWAISSSCVESTSTLRDCVSSDHSMSGENMLFLNCSDSVRLVHGSSLCSGRLQVRSNQSWSSVCEEDLDLNDAQVVCRELGCGAPSVLRGALYGQGEAPVWTSEFQCEGNESVLLDCGRSASDTCSSGRAVDVTCADPIRLVGEPSGCAGTVEMEKQSDWRAVGTSEQWSLESGSALCQRLDCGSAVSVKTKDDFPDRPVWFISSTCVKSTSGLRDCWLMNHNDNHTSGVEVVCSGLLPQPIISLSVSDGLFEVYQRGFRLLLGSAFTVTCSVEPQYPGGSFQLISDTSNPQNLTLPAVNHSAHFLFAAIGHAHRGDYTCVYHLDVFNRSFSSPQSPVLYLTIGASVMEVVIRTVLVILILFISTVSMFFFCKVWGGQLRLKARTAPGPPR